MCSLYLESRNFITCFNSKLNKPSPVKYFLVIKSSRLSTDRIGHYDRLLNFWVLSILIHKNSVFKMYKWQKEIFNFVY